MEKGLAHQAEEEAHLEAVAKERILASGITAMGKDGGSVRAEAGSDGVIKGLPSLAEALPGPHTEQPPSRKEGRFPEETGRAGSHELTLGPRRGQCFPSRLHFPGEPHLLSLA